MGTGLEQERVRECSPPPQDTEQIDHLLQGVQLPFTVKIIINIGGFLIKVVSFN